MALPQLPETVEEGLLTLQIWAFSCAVWMEMAAVYDGLIEILAPARPHREVARLLERLRNDRSELARARATVENQRRRYADAYEESRRALRAPGGSTLAEQIARTPATASHAAAFCSLSRLLAERFAGVELADERALDGAVELLIHYLLAEQAIVAAASELRASLEKPRARSKALPLGRPEGACAPPPAQTPYLLDAFEEEMGIRLTCTAAGIDVVDLRGDGLCSDGAPSLRMGRGGSAA